MKTLANLVAIYYRAGNGLIGSMRIAFKTLRRTK